MLNGVTTEDHQALHIKHYLCDSFSLLGQLLLGLA